MHEVKAHKTIEQIAKKHRLDVSFVSKQLEMGIPIEHEHTKDKDLATDIALQHLDEIPDYYTRLKKMEASAKKEHKKFKDVKEDADSGVDDMDSPIHPVHAIHVDHEKRYCPKCKRVELRSQCKYGPKCWDMFSSPAKLKEEKSMQDEKRYCPLCDKRETRSECSYGGKAWDKVSVKDHEYSMARSELSTIADAVKRLNMKVGKGEGNLEAWVQSKITKAADYIDTVADYIASGEMEEALSFELGPKFKTAQKIAKASEISKKGSTEGERTAGKKAVQRLGGTAAELPKIKEENLVNKILGELEEDKKKGLWDNIHARREKGLPRKKPGQKGYPETLDIDEDLEQARKNVGASKCWKGKVAKGTKIKNGKEVPNCVPAESVTIEDANGNPYVEFVDLIKPDPLVSETYRLPPNNGNILLVTVMWRGATYSTKMFFPQINIPSRKDVTDEIQKVYPGAKVLAYQPSNFQPGQALIVTDRRSKNYLITNKTIGEEVELEEDWQSVNRKDKTDGLSQKAVNAYRRENPGSKLQTAVTEKKPKGKRKKRRKSFCSRMKGMKSKLTSAKTARDPDSRINKALRRWNCN
jgi:hypothetical protein